MHRYASSKARILLFIVLLGAAIFAVGNSFGQETAGTPTAASSVAPPAVKKATPGVGSLIMQNLDFVFFTIMGCSVIAVTLIVQGFIKVRRPVMIPESSNNQIREMIAQRQFKELIDFTETDPSFVSRALNPALKRAPSFNSMKEAMETAIGEQTADQFRKIEYLNIIGNLGPLLGLLGTVLGMIKSFNELNAAAGEAKPADLAIGIATALTHTMLGLMLAIPCLAAFGILRTMVDRLTVQGALVAEEMLLMIKPAEAKPVGSAPPGASARAGALPQPAVPVAAAATPRKVPTPPPLTAQA